jgi:hypothetical protein
MSWKTLTALVIVAVIVGLIVYDLIAYAVGGNPATISRTVLRISQRAGGFGLSVAFALGVLVGHLFLPQRPTRDEDDQEEEDNGPRPAPA